MTGGRGGGGGATKYPPFAYVQQTQAVSTTATLLLERTNCQSSEQHRVEVCICTSVSK